LQKLNNPRLSYDNLNMKIWEPMPNFYTGTRMSRRFEKSAAEMRVD